MCTDRTRISVVDLGEKNLYNKNSNLDLITLLGVANYVLNHFHIKISVFIVTVGSRCQDCRRWSQAMRTFVIDILYRTAAKNSHADLFEATFDGYRLICGPNGLSKTIWVP